MTQPDQPKTMQELRSRLIDLSPAGTSITLEHAVFAMRSEAGEVSSSAKFKIIVLLGELVFSNTSETMADVFSFFESAVLPRLRNKA